MRQFELYKYNPSQCSLEELEATFVARKDILATVLDDLRAQAKKPANQHFLITGPKGIGKTNMLLMIRNRLKNDKDLSRAYIPLQTAEEEYSISSLRDFFARLLSLLIEAETEEELDAALKTANSTDDNDEGVEIAIAALKGFSKRVGRKLLLLIDNLDLIIGDQLSDDAELGRLRDVLMNDSFLILVAAAPTYFKEVSGYNRPFYNFFKPIDLEDFTLEQMSNLLLKRAVWEENHTLLNRFDELQPRLKAIHHLTGGNPRLTLMLYQLFTRSDLPEVRATLQMLLDDLTPYYKARLEHLSPQQRKVMDTFARLGTPATPTELALETRLPVNQVNSILKRLRELGFVSIAPQKRRKITLYMVSERVFRIWHQMRFSPAGRQKLEFLIEFIRIWYSTREWLEEANRIMGEYRKAAGENRFIQAERFVEHLEYLVNAAPQAELGYSLADETLQVYFESGDLDNAEKVIDQRICNYTREGNSDRLAQTWYRKGQLHNRQKRTLDEIDALKKAVEIQPDFHEALFCCGNAYAELARMKKEKKREQLLQQACDKYAAAVKGKPDKYKAFYNWGIVLSEIAKMKTGQVREKLFQQACEKYESLVKLKPDEYFALTNWGASLSDLARMKRGQEREELFQQACKKYADALKIKPDDYNALNNMGNALSALAEMKQGQEREQLFQQACGRFADAQKVNPNEHLALHNWCAPLIGLAEMRKDSKRNELFEQAFQFIDQAITKAEKEHEQESVALYHAHFVQIALFRCALALEADNLGQALNLFKMALDRLPQSKEKSAEEGLVRFFLRIVSKGRAAFCAELFNILRTRKLEREIGILAPFAAAIEYWEKEEDVEVLDRLNPELRKIVKSITSRTVPKAG